MGSSNLGPKQLSEYQELELKRSDLKMSEAGAELKREKVGVLISKDAHSACEDDDSSALFSNLVYRMLVLSAPKF
jgi:hypothetical protein